jgi:hypothetical protein
MYFQPMIKMNLIDGYDPQTQFNNLAFLDLKNGDVIEWEYQFNLGKPHQLVATISPQFSRYQDIKTRTDIGVRLQTDSLDIAFVYFDREEMDYGAIKLTLLSASYKLEHSPLEYKNQFYSGSLETFLQAFTDFEFIRIGDDVNVVIPSTGGLTNLEVVQEAISYPFFYNWLEIGIKEVAGVFKTMIVYGDLRNIEDFYNANASTYPQLEPTNVRMLNDLDNDDLNTAILQSYKIVENTLKFNHVYAYNDNGGGSSPNTIIELEPDADYVNPQYPVVTIDGVNYVQVPEAPNYPIKIKVYPVTEPANTEDNTGTQQTTTAISAEVAYRRTISYIQSFKASRYYRFEIGLKKLTLAGVPQKIRFKNTVYSDDGSILYQQDIDETVIPSQYSGNGNEIFN